jgi:hypothetical protein
MSVLLPHSPQPALVAEGSYRAFKEKFQDSGIKMCEVNTPDAFSLEETRSHREILSNIKFVAGIARNWARKIALVTRPISAASCALVMSLLEARQTFGGIE